jgi:hypothetical protein
LESAVIVKDKYGPLGRPGPLSEMNAVGFLRGSVETCWIAGNTQKRSESHDKSKIRLLYRGETQ